VVAAAGVAGVAVAVAVVVVQKKEDP